MARFISIPVTAKGTTLINVDSLGATSYVSATSIVLVTAGKTTTLTIAGATTTNAYDTIIKAILALQGPTVSPVVFPNGATCTAVTVTA
jgi:hypothetical protein